MAKYKYTHVVKKNKEFKKNLCDIIPISPELRRFTKFLWAGKDGGIWCVYRQDPKTKEIVRIEFFPPEKKKCSI